MGWKEGEAIGADKSAKIETLQASTRKELLGLQSGKDGEGGGSGTQWDDWWNKSYNKIAQKERG
jgi:G-patch domain